MTPVGSDDAAFARLYDEQFAPLHRLATRAELIDPEAWAATQPSISDQENDWVGP